MCLWGNIASTSTKRETPWRGLSRFLRSTNTTMASSLLCKIHTRPSNNWLWCMMWTPRKKKSDCRAIKMESLSKRILFSSCRFVKDRQPVFFTTKTTKTYVKWKIFPLSFLFRNFSITTCSEKNISRLNYCKSVKSEESFGKGKIKRLTLWLITSTSKVSPKYGSSPRVQSTISCTIYGLLILWIW